MSDLAAAALVGNMAVESRVHGVDLAPGKWQIGSRPSTHTLTSPDSGFGIAQWTLPARKEALKNFAGELPVGNFAVELAFVAHELSHPEEQGHLLIQRDTLRQLQRPDISIQEATAIVMAVYEAPETYQQVPNYPSVSHLLKEFGKGPITGPDPNDPAGYDARLSVAKKIASANR